MNTRIEGEKVQVQLFGRVGFGPYVSVERAVVDDGRLKIQSGNGYEHFELDHFIDRDGIATPVFVWSERTLIAE